MGGEYIIVKQNRDIRRFKKADAKDSASALTLEEIGVRNDRIFRGLLDRGVFAEAGGERYYIDLDRAEEFISQRRRRALFAALLGMLLFIVLYFLGFLK
jgi:hypothetical protein